MADDLPTRPLPSFDLGLNWPMFRQPKLRLWAWPDPVVPYEADALSPAISELLLREHVGQFAQRYVERFNRALQYGEGGRDNLQFAWGGIVLHHLYFWGMQPGGYQLDEDGPLARFLSYGGGRDGWIESMVLKASENQGSGWLVLAMGDHNRRLEILLLDNHDLRPLQKRTPLVVVDLWEHAYIPEYRNKPLTYVRSALNQAVNWQLADLRLQACLGRGRRLLRVAPAGR